MGKQNEQGKKTKPSKKSHSIGLSILSALLLLIGLALVFNQQIKDILMDRLVAEQKTEQYTATVLKDNNEAPANFDLDTVVDVDMSEVLKATMTQSDLPVIGFIAVPAVSLDLPIYKGVANEQLLSGAGTLREDQKMGIGNYPLASHRMANPTLLFTPLLNLKLGDKIYLTDLETIYTYKTTYIDTVEPDRIDLAYEEDVTTTVVTLFTCNVTGSKREVFRGELEETTAFDQADANIQAMFQ
ncbi:MAG: class A sortase [Bavariicoccus seileri]|uniref:class A sortase n=1 Tax=Bavariicoccus seileri TaxID=549685 RepID=UPI003F92BE75